MPKSKINIYFNFNQGMTGWLSMLEKCVKKNVIF